MPERYRPLIEKIIKANTRYNGNEDLFEDFCSETFKRCYKILSTEETIVNFEAYLTKVASSAILDVLRTSGRLRRLKSGYKKIQQQTIAQGYTTDEHCDIIYQIEDPSPTVEESLIKKEEVVNIRTAIKEINNEFEDKQFTTIFKMRYIDGKRQADIASELNISQGEVSKRLIELSKRVLGRLH